MLLLLVLYAFTLPLLVAAFVNKLWLAILIDIIAVQSFFALNEVARDLEDPFVYEPNDLPMARIQVVSPPEMPSTSTLCLMFKQLDSYALSKSLQATFRNIFTDSEAVVLISESCNHHNWKVAVFAAKVQSELACLMFVIMSEV